MFIAKNVFDFGSNLGVTKFVGQEAIWLMNFP